MKSRHLIIANMILILIASCGGKSEDGKSDQTAASKETSANATDVASILPRSEELAGFDKFSDERTLVSEELLDYLGDDSTLYANYDAIAAATADYRDTTRNLQFAIDVYQFPGYSEAFGIYAHYRDTSYTFLDIGTQGFLNDGRLLFFCGDYFVKVTAYANTAEDDSTAIYLGKITANRMKQKAVYPAAVLLMPDSAKIANSAQYIPSNLLDHEFFSPAYTCLYHVVDSISTLVFIPRGSTAELLQYKQILINRGNTVVEDQQGDLRLYFCDDDRFGRVIMSSRAGRLAGVINTPDRPNGMELLMRLWKNVDEAQNQGT